MGTKEKHLELLVCRLKIQPLIFRVPNHLKAICLFWHWFLSVPPAFFWVSLWTLKLCIDVGRWQVGKLQISPLQLGPGSWAGGLCWEKLGLEVFKVVLWCNTSCGRNPPFVWLKDLVSELLNNPSCWRSVVHLDGGHNHSCPAQHGWQVLSGGNLRSPGRELGGGAVIPQPSHSYMSSGTLYVCFWSFCVSGFQLFSCMRCSKYNFIQRWSDKLKEPRMVGWVLM